MSLYRTHHLGEIDKKCLNKQIKVAGWLDTIRDHGGITFVELRDQFGKLQIVLPNKEIIAGLMRESVISIEGKLIKRAKQNINKKIALGEFELAAEKIEVLGKAYEVLPFEIETSTNVKEDMRLKYRFLDLRNKKLANNILFRSELIKAMREQMQQMNFNEFQTPIITSSSPEGARDFLVPSRLHPGKFYALPQAPQQFKQLLMASGFNRYFQIAPCFRDEDGRADRTPGEFYQLDLEMSFASQEDVFLVAENLIANITKKFASLPVSKAPFRRIKFEHAMETYGSDKPDLRNPILIYNLTQVFLNTAFNAFKGCEVRGLCVKTGEQPRSFFDNLTDVMIKEHGAKGLVWFKVEDGEKLNGPVAKFLTESEIKEIVKVFDAKAGDAIFMLADKIKLPLQKLAGSLRTELGRRLNLIDKTKMEFCWIVDFPMYELNDESKIDFGHNPFSMPQGGMNALKNTDPLDIYAFQYDLVLNGYELASGAVRNHEPEIMVEAFKIAGYDESTVLTKFPALYNAFKFGAPPHAGMAFGLDRLIMILLGVENIREVIAFPMTNNGMDLLMGAPGEVSEKQLREAHIKLRQ